MKRFLAVLLTVCMMLPLLAALPLSAAAAPTEGVSFDDNSMYHLNGKPDRVPYTVSFWINIPGDIELHGSGKGAGVLLSNYTGFDVMPYLHLSVYGSSKSDLHPYLEWKDLYDTNNSNAAKQVVKCDFVNVILPLDEWVHITVVLDPYNTSAYCYKNGTLAQTIGKLRFMMGDMASYLRDLPFVIGNDNRNGQPYYFKGKLAALSMFADIRTATEISADYAAGTFPVAATLSDADTLGYWAFTAADAGKPVTALAGGLDLIPNQIWIDPEDMELPTGYDYTMIAVGDTQYMVQYDAKNGTDYTNRVYKWIVDNAAALDLQVVMGLGDITNTDEDSHWDVIYKAIAQLNGKVPYTLVRGNHDHLKGGATFEEKFGNDSAYMGQFSGKTGGVMTAGSAANTYYSFSAGGTDWLIVNLDWAPTDTILGWADGVIKAHPDHKVIVNTHCYLHLDATTCDEEDTSTKMTVGVQNYGDDIWDELIYENQNVVMVLSGHQEANLVTMTQGKGKHGNTVSQFLIDPQAVDTYTINTTSTPSGIVTVFYFKKDGTAVDVRHYSPIRDQYYQSVNQFSFDMAADVPVQGVDDWNGYSIAPAGEGTKENPYIISHPGHLVWMGSQISRDEKIQKNHFGVNYDYNDYSAGCFDGKYFKQVCDIDLGGRALSTIGYYSTYEYHKDGLNYIRMAAFGGHYDGGGYSIKNGKIISETDFKYTVNFNWCDGLFGCIYGATIENLVLEDLTYHAQGILGSVVGKAIAPADGKAPSDFNVISNCHVKNTCDFHFKFPEGAGIRKDLAYDTIYQSGIVGGICGVAYATTVKNCTFDAALSVDGYRSLVGGIAGIAGYNSVIDHCAFTGSVTLTDHTARIMQTFGGIVGYYAPNDTSVFYDDKGNLNFDGDLTVTNCYNNGEFTYMGAQLYTQESHWGGILGHAPAVPTGYTVLIENCYNLCHLPRHTDTDWIGGILGKGKSVGVGGSILLRHCASVTVGAQGGEGNNELRYADASAVTEATNVLTATAANLQSTVNAIALDIARAGNTEPNKWITGNGIPTAAANAGDMYLDLATGNVYQFVHDWVLVTNIKGEQGDQGEQGVQGEKGDKGDQGYQGIQGEKGDKGDQGIQGEKGEQGDQGEQGIQGEKGDKGDQGEQGIQGEKGDKGDQGEQGIQGEKGDKGDQGIQGEKGDKGDQGEQGIQGEKGDKGDQGEPGKDGKDGADAAVSDSANTAGDASGSHNDATAENGGNGLAIAAIVIAVVVGIVNTALIVALSLKKKKTA